MGRVVLSLLVAVAVFVIAGAAPLRDRYDRVEVDVQVRLPDGADPAAVLAVWRERLAGHDVTVARDLVTVTGPRMLDPAAVAGALAAGGQLELRRVIAGSDVMRDLYARYHDDAIDGVRAEIDAWRHDESGRISTDYYLYGPDPAVLARAIPPGIRVGLEWVESHGEAPSHWRTYVLDDEVILDRRGLAEAVVIWDPQTSRPDVLLTFTTAGAAAFADATARLAGDKLAILVDGRVLSAPVIQAPIPGGKATIGLGAGDPARQQRAAEVLAAALSARGELPARIVTRVVDVRPTSTATVAAVRAVAAALAAALTWLLAGAIVRRTARAPAIPRTGRAAPADLALPLAITALTLLGLELLGRVYLPALDVERIDELFPGAAPRRWFSFAALGMAPVVAAFVLVEVVALVVPAWRRVRGGTPAARRDLDLTVFVVAALLAVAQAYVYARWLGRFELGGHAGVITAALVAGVAVHAGAALLIGREGIGHGWLVVVTYALGRALVDAARTAPAPEVVVAAWALAGAVAIALTTRRAGLGDGRRLPVGGVVPAALVPLAVFAITLPFATAHLAGVADAFAGRPLALDLAIAALVATAIARGRDPLVPATAIGFALVLAALPWASAAGAAAGAVLAVALVDLGRAIALHARVPGAVALVALHDVARADALVDELADAGIPAYATGAASRAILGALGPFAPVVVYVPRDRAADAATRLPARRSAPPPPSSAATAG